MANAGQPPAALCGLDGNPDLTGLGLRAALYIQTVTFSIAGEFVPAEAASLYGSAIALLLAIFVALVRETIMGSLRAPEVAVVLWLFVSQFAGSVRALKRSGFPSSAAGRARSYLHFAILCSYLGYATWFWFAGLDTLPRTACDEYAFFFTKVDVRGWFRTLAKVAFVFFWVPLGLFIGYTIFLWSCSGVRHSLRAILREEERQKKSKEAVTATEDPVADEMIDFLLTGPEARQFAAGQAVAWQQLPAMTYRLFRATGSALVFLAIMIPPTELQIQWNEIRGVQTLDSVGQLVPFIMALGQLAHVLYSTLRSVGNDDYAYEKEAEGSEDPPGCPKKGVHPDEEHHELLQTSTAVPTVPKTSVPDASVDTSYQSVRDSLPNYDFYGRRIS